MEERITHRFKGTFGVYGVCARQQSAALGQGSSGTVFTCTEVNTGREFALKLVWMAHLGDDIYKESAVLAWARGVPGFVQLVDIVTLEQGQAKQPCVGLVLDLHVRGSLDHAAASRSLRERLDSAPTILRDLLRSLHWLHESGFAHRDIKPANVLLANEGEGVVLADLGRCVCADQIDYIVNATTPLVESPEQLTGLPYDCSSDLWSAGVTVLAYVFGHGDARGELEADARDVYFRNLVRLPPDQSPPDDPSGDAPLVERMEAFFAAHGSPSAFLRSLCRAATGLPNTYVDRYFAFCETLDGIMERDPAARWSAQDALHVLETAVTTTPPIENTRALRRCVKRRLLQTVPDDAQFLATAIFSDVVYVNAEIAERALASFVKHWHSILLD